MNTLKNVVKKAIAVGSGAVMLGATTAGALADLGDYPSPFIQNGQFDGLIVVGERAASSDIIGAIDIAASLQASATTPVNTGTGSSRTVLTGDVKQIGDSGDLLEIGEQIGDVTETITDDDLEMLRSGTVSTQAGSTDFTQTLELNPTGLAATSNLVVLDENDDDETGVFLLFEGGEPLFTYEVEFSSGLESDLDLSATPDAAEDLENEQIYLLGQWYTISEADVPASDDDVTLTLLAGDVTDTLTQGETKTYEVDGQEYEVTVLAIGNDGTSVKFLVNGEATDSMSVDDTETLAGGLEIGVRDIIETTAYRESDPGSIVEFYLGANKIEITDSDVTSDDGGASVEINDENIEDLDADISATVTATDVRINSLIFTLNVDAVAGSNIYVAEGEGVREYLDEPEGMLAMGWDITFAGLSEPDSSEISFDASGDDEYTLTFTNTRGDTYRVPYAFATGADASKFGSEDDDFHFWESLVTGAGATNLTVDATTYIIDDDDYFLLTDDDADNAGDSYVLQFTDVETDDSIVTFTNVANGQEITATYDPGLVLSQAANSVPPSVLDTPSGDITIGGKDFSFWLRNLSGVYTLAVDADNDGLLAGVGSGATTAATTTETITGLVTRGGAIVELASATTAVPLPTNGDWSVEVNTLDEDVDNNVAQMVQVDFTTDGSTEFDLDVDAASSTGTIYSQNVQDEDRTVAVNRYGAWFEATDETNEADSLVITYPHEQVEALVYVVGGEATTSTSATGGSGARVNPVGVGAAVLDRDVRYDQDNMIVVGGPCVNTMAAQLLGNPADCAEGFEPGHAMIRLFDTGVNTALLVAGYEAQDTVGASRVLAESGDYDLDGNAVDVVVESLNNIDVRPASN